MFRKLLRINARQRMRRRKKQEEVMKKLSVFLASLVLALGLVFVAACTDNGAKEQPLE